MTKLLLSMGASANTATAVYYAMSGNVLWAASFAGFAVGSCLCAIMEAIEDGPRAAAPPRNPRT